MSLCRIPATWRDRGPYLEDGRPWCAFYGDIMLMPSRELRAGELVCSFMSYKRPSMRRFSPFSVVVLASACDVRP